MLTAKHREWLVVLESMGGSTVMVAAEMDEEGGHGHGGKHGPHHHGRGAKHGKPHAHGHTEIIIAEMDGGGECEPPEQHEHKKPHKHGKGGGAIVIEVDIEGGEPPEPHGHGHGQPEPHHGHEKPHHGHTKPHHGHKKPHHDPPPEPCPEPPPSPEPAFTPPPEAKQPTLRKGDKSGDGWVEYLQQQLTQQLHRPVPVTGEFDAATQKAVLDFQAMKKLQKDGTVGNQTWAALRDAPPEKPSTDGRKPHSFVEQGPEARWQREGEPCIYHRDSDEAWLLLNSVGTGDIAKGKATVQVTAPSGKKHVTSVAIGPPTQATPDGQGNVHTVKVPKLLASFKDEQPEPALGDYKVEAYLDSSLGGDYWTGPLTEG